jgi:hypothetical protein
MYFFWEKVSIYLSTHGAVITNTNEMGESYEGEQTH